MALKLTGVSHAPWGRTPWNQEEKPLPLLHLSVSPGPPLTKPNNMPAGKGSGSSVTKPGQQGWVRVDRQFICLFSTHTTALLC